METGIKFHSLNKDELVYEVTISYEEPDGVVFAL